MCTYSMIMDHYRDKWQPLVPTPWPIGPIIPSPITPTVPDPHFPPIDAQPEPQPAVINIRPLPTAAEIDEFRQLLDKAREYDRRTGQADCESAEKIAALKLIAKALGIDLSFIEDKPGPVKVEGGADMKPGATDRAKEKVETKPVDDPQPHTRDAVINQLLERVDELERRLEDRADGLTRRKAKRTKRMTV